MAWRDIHVNDAGWVGKLRLVQNAAAVNLASYTTRHFVFRSPSGQTKTRLAAFESNGTDGVLSYMVQPGDIDEAGVWSVQARIAKAGGVELSSNEMRFKVERRL